METKDILKALIPAIEKVDGGCGACIVNFIDTANEGLEAAGFSWRYEFVNTVEKYGVRLINAK